MSIDFDDIKSRFRVSEIVGRYISLSKSGHEFVGLCPFHADHSPSLHVIDAKKFWHCFGCGESGDVFDFVTLHDGVTTGEAAEIITGQRQSKAAIRTPPEAKLETFAPADNFKPIMPAPTDAPPLIIADGMVRFYSHRKEAFVERKVVATYPYRDDEGQTLGYVIRQEWEKDGKRHKLTPTVIYCEMTDGSFAWVDRGFPEPRPLYGLDALAAMPGKTAFVVEGEKSVDAARRMFPKNPVVGWPNGTNSVDKAEWSALKGRKVIFWPDADAQKYPDRRELAGDIKPIDEQPGTKAMNEAAAILAGIADPLVLLPPEGKTGGWDAADAESEWGADQTAAWLKSAIEAAYAARVVAPPAERGDMPSDASEPDMVAYDGPPEDGGAEYDDSEFQAPFRVLGHDRGIFYYLPRGSRQVVELSAPGHTKLNLYQLASPSWWDSAFPARKGCDWDIAAAALMSQAYEAGVFNRGRKRRGRGAWVDNGRNVYHLGDKLWVDGQITGIEEFQTAFVYEQADAMDLDLSKPLNNKAAHETLLIAQEFSWQADLHAYLLAGWVVIAPVCGVLEWRPHFWMTGPTGSGKSTIMRDYVGGLVGQTAFIAEGGTTEAAIRQSLDGDARPVIFDEAEPKDSAAQARLRAVLDLARVASSESGGEIVKGGNNHQAKSFRVRSCFGLASINPAIEFAADETRFTRFMLARPVVGDDEEAKEISGGKWEEVAARMANTITPEYAEGLLARTVRNLVTLRDNSRTFSKAATTLFGSARHGQQFGPMLAGCYLLHSTNLVDYETALKWMREKRFDQIITTTADDADDARCIAHILQARLRATITQGRTEDYSVAELLERYNDSALDYDMVDTVAAYLKRMGLKPENGGLWVANKHSDIARVMAGTPWATGWRDTLATVPGAIKSDGPIYFSKYMKQRAVWIPASALR